MQVIPKSSLLKTGIVAVALCLGATALYAWQGHVRATKDERKPILAAGSMSALIRESHDSAHIENLPVQVIEERD
jgi:hypothetical protein